MSSLSQRKLPTAPTGDGSLGSSMASGAREPRKNAPSPPSGVRSRQELPLTEFKAPRLELEDSEPLLTRVREPDPTLLAATRGGRGATASPGLKRFGWFVLGAGAGALVVWLATGDAIADVYRARLWVAAELRALHGQTDAADPAASSSATPPPPEAAQSPTGAPMPTVDVERLPRAVPRPPATTISPPSFPPSAPGAPVLQRAPGPR